MKKRYINALHLINHWKSTEAEEIFLENRGITDEELASELDVSVDRACVIIKSMHYRKVCDKWVPSTKEVESGTKECASLTEEVYIALLKSGLQPYKGK